MELYNLKEAAEQLGKKYHEVWYVFDKLGVGQGDGEIIQSQSGTTRLLTDKGLAAFRDYFAAMERYYARQPKSFGDKVIENQKKLAVERAKRAADALLKKDLELVQNELQNLKTTRSTNKARMQELSKKETELKAKLQK